MFQFLLLNEVLNMAKNRRTQEEKEIMQLEKDFNILKNRITKHRRKCPRWNIFITTSKSAPCFDCHYSTLTKIEKDLEELRYL